jgi:hypothetical protein
VMHKLDWSVILWYVYNARIMYARTRARQDLGSSRFKLVLYL